MAISSSMAAFPSEPTLPFVPPPDLTTAISAVTIAGKNYFVADVEHFLRSYDGAEAVLALAHLPDHESGRQSVVLLVEIKGMLTTGMKEADKRGD